MGHAKDALETDAASARSSSELPCNTAIRFLSSLSPATARLLTTFGRVWFGPSTRRVGDAAAGAAAAEYIEYDFTSAPVVGPSVQYTYTLVGDLGQTEHSLSTLHHMQGSGGRLVVHVGDLSYADGFQPRWDSYGRFVEPRACRLLPSSRLAASHPVRALKGEPRATGDGFPKLT